MRARSTKFESNAIAPTTSFSGKWASLRVTSVITPNVPSLPQNNLVKSYPVELFRARDLVLRTWPPGSTTVRLRTQSFIVPYLTALVPEAEVAIIPPMCAFGPGSTGRKRPYGLR